MLPMEGFANELALRLTDMAPRRPLWPCTSASLVTFRQCTYDKSMCVYFMGVLLFYVETMLLLFLEKTIKVPFVFGWHKEAHLGLCWHIGLLHNKQSAECRVELVVVHFDVDILF